MRWPRPLLPISLFVTIVTILVITLPSPVSADCGADASSCKVCHEGEQQKPVNAVGLWHTQHAFGDFCANCHAGDKSATDETDAHTGMRPVLADPKETCSACHADNYQTLAATYENEKEKGAGTVIDLKLPPPGSNNTLFIWVNIAVFILLSASVWAFERGPFSGRRKGYAPMAGGSSALASPQRLVSFNPLALKQWSPYAAGTGLGLVAVGALWLSGQPLGSSGAFMTATSTLLKASGSSLADSVYFKFVSPPALTWQALLVVGIVLGALLSAAWSRDFRFETAPDLWVRTFGPARWKRWGAMFLGGMILEFGASVAGGCTSGLAIAGSLQLSGAGFLFIAGLFTTGLITARLIYGRKY